ncbi:potassium channel family protein [Lichenibacterium ramalinae]|uniref:Potassium channel protein n=1 Tax=Lichenibacterium ramalinae TaxID=2316527 RepID=A0A4Q2RFW9_9HYPH|nr:ion channel [Lichenibacterium ramalinae]RYB04603.1 potassium channel protein [Lichenibacterium ramalinae]
MRPPPARGDGTDPGGTRGGGPTRSRSQSPSRAGGSIFGHHHIRQTLDRLQVAYLGLVATQVSALLLYEWRVASGSLVLALGLVTSLVGPGLSVVVGVRVFQQRRLSRGFDVASAALTYVVTCISFAIVYAIIAERVPHAFTLPAGEADPIGFGSALYFSVVTITTTGFGDIAPLAGLARTAACCEIGTGLLYQVFIFTMAASLFGPAPRTDDGQARHAP